MFLLASLSAVFQWVNTVELPITIGWLPVRHQNNAVGLRAKFQPVGLSCTYILKWEPMLESIATTYAVT